MRAQDKSPNLLRSVTHAYQSMFIPFFFFLEGLFYPNPKQGLDKITSSFSIVQRLGPPPFQPTYTKANQ